MNLTIYNTKIFRFPKMENLFIFILRHICGCGKPKFCRFFKFSAVQDFLRFIGNAENGANLFYDKFIVKVLRRRQNGLDFFLRVYNL